MPGFVLDAGASILCPHGGRGAPSPTAVRVKVGGKPPLRVSDPVTIAGCPFTVSGAPSPCLRVQWLMPATTVRVEGAAVLLSSSVGLCVNAAGAPQGTALVSGFQTRVQAR